MDKYKITKTLGDGTYGSVVKAINTQTKEEVAIKKMKKKFYSWEECMALREIKSLRKQLDEERRRQAQSAPHAALAAPSRPKALALVDEDEVAIEVELSHAIELVKSTAEYELRELQTFVAALVGDFDMSADHNPFRPATYARAVWSAAQALPLSRGHQILFMRQCAEPLAQVMRQAFAATTSRLESWGVEPAAYRTLILPSGSRRGARSAARASTAARPELPQRVLWPSEPAVATQLPRCGHSVTARVATRNGCCRFRIQFCPTWALNWLRRRSGSPAPWHILIASTRCSRNDPARTAHRPGRPRPRAHPW